MVLSSKRRREARPTPKPRPSSKPRAKLIDFFGFDGASAGIAIFTVETFTGESTPIP